MTFVPTLNHLFFEHLANFEYPDLLAAGKQTPARVWSTADFRDSVLRLHAYLANLGLRPGDHIALLSENRPEWHIADFAILLTRAVTVPLYTTLPSGQLRDLLSRSCARALIVSSRERWLLVAPILHLLPALEFVILIDEAPGVPVPSFPTILSNTPLPALESVRDSALRALPSDVATLIYTSGTTGSAKGVLLTHSNLIFDLEGCSERIRHVRPWPRRALSILPLSHVLERLLCYAYFRLGIPIAYGDPVDLRDLLLVHRPEVIGAVPRVLERVREAVLAQVEKLPSWKRRVARESIGAAINADRARFQKKSVSLSDQARSGIANFLIFPKIRRQLGQLQYVICGGAWLNPDVEHFFRASGFSVLQGYGLTETSPVICLTIPGRERPGTVGPPLAGVSLRLTDDGEILVRGDNVMKGYFNEPEATAAVLRDGWFKTGDLGRFDQEGNLVITGRTKEILVLSTGKNVACQATERALLACSYFAHCFVFGDGQKFVTALVVPHWPALRQFDGPDEPARFLVHPPIVKEIYAELEILQQSLSPHERVKRFCWLHESILLDPDLVTPSQKVRRHVLAARYAGALTHMVNDPAPLFLLPTQSVPAPVHVE